MTHSVGARHPLRLAPTSCFYGQRRSRRPPRGTLTVVKMTRPSRRPSPATKWTMTRHGRLRRVRQRPRERRRPRRHCRRGHPDHRRCRRDRLGSNLLIPTSESTRLNILHDPRPRWADPTRLLSGSPVATRPRRSSARRICRSIWTRAPRTISLSDYVITRSGRSPLVEGSSPVAGDRLGRRRTPFTQLT